MHEMPPNTNKFFFSHIVCELFSVEVLNSINKWAKTFLIIEAEIEEFPVMSCGTTMDLFFCFVYINQI